MQNTLYYGDNLDILRRFVDDQTVDLIYLDPPFNSNRDYNVLFKEQSGAASPAQIKAFGDTWNWAGAAPAWADFPALCPNAKVIELMWGFHNTLDENDVMAYLVMMAPRLFHLHRALKPTGSLYLHCDPTASAYLRLILDALFKPRNFKNEIIWKRTSAHSSAKRYGPIHDNIYYYSKSDIFTWNPHYTAHGSEYIETFFDQTDADGRRWKRSDLTGAGTRNGETGQVWRGIDVTAKGRHWAYPPSVLEELDVQGRVHWPNKPGGMPRLKQYPEDLAGIPLQDVWNDIRPMHNLSQERMGYPTQKPLALLERIISASSNPGDVVLDPFCGCGTAVVAAQKLGRRWVGIDITPIATSLVQKRLFDAFEARDSRLVSADDPQAQARAFRVEGLPTDEAGARAMFEADHKKFEMWAVGLIPAIPQEKKGADGGIDGVAYFDVGGKDLAKAVVQVKGGRNIGAAGVQQLRGAMGKNNAPLGFYVSLEAPTKPMLAEALAAGFYKAPTGVGRQVPALQVRTVAELLCGRDFDFPVTGANASFKQAAAIARAAGQGTLGLD
ncbi:MAG: restriction endonuclease [Armatimonadetes bacterium]|nr:restriction endonuclease [Armatimonadota bacterium]